MDAEKGGADRGREDIRRIRVRNERGGKDGRQVPGTGDGEAGSGRGMGDAREFAREKGGVRGESAMKGNKDRQKGGCPRKSPLILALIGLLDGCECVEIEAPIMSEDLAA